MDYQSFLILILTISCSSLMMESCSENQHEAEQSAAKTKDSILTVERRIKEQDSINSVIAMAEAEKDAQEKVAQEIAMAEAEKAAQETAKRKEEGIYAGLKLGTPLSTFLSEHPEAKPDRYACFNFWSNMGRKNLETHCIYRKVFSSGDEADVGAGFYNDKLVYIMAKYKGSWNSSQFQSDLYNSLTNKYGPAVKKLRGSDSENYYWKIECCFIELSTHSSFMGAYVSVSDREYQKRLMNEAEEKNGKMIE